MSRRDRPRQAEVLLQCGQLQKQRLALGQEETPLAVGKPAVFALGLIIGPRQILPAFRSRVRAALALAGEYLAARRMILARAFFVLARPRNFSADSALLRSKIGKLPFWLPVRMPCRLRAAAVTLPLLVRFLAMMAPF